MPKKTSTKRRAAKDDGGPEINLSEERLLPLLFRETTPAPDEARTRPQVARGRGRPNWEPTEAMRSTVQAFSAAGYDQVRIAAYLGVSETTLVKHCRAELQDAGMFMIGGAVGKLQQAIAKGEAWAICFLLKTKGKALGFSERHEHTGADGKDLFDGLDLTRLSPHKFDQLKELLRDAGAPIASHAIN